MPVGQSQFYPKSKTSQGSFREIRQYLLEQYTAKLPKCPCLHIPKVSHACFLRLSLPVSLFIMVKLDIKDYFFLSTNKWWHIFFIFFHFLLFLSFLYFLGFSILSSLPALVFIFILHALMSPCKIKINTKIAVCIINAKLAHQSIFKQWARASK